MTDLTRTMANLSPDDRAKVFTLSTSGRILSDDRGLFERLAKAMNEVHFPRMAARHGRGQLCTPSRLRDMREGKVRAVVDAMAFAKRSYPLHTICRTRFEVGEEGQYEVELDRVRPNAEHRLALPRDWLKVIGEIGDGSGIIGKYMVLSARREFHDPLGDRAFWFARLARKGSGPQVKVEDKVLSCWPYEIVTVHDSLKSAMREHPPAEVVERIVADKAARAAQVLDEEDIAALRGLV